MGNGGQSRVIQEIIASTKEHKVIAILDDKYERGFQVKGIIHAPLSFLVKLFKKNTKVVVAIGRNDIRKKIVQGLNLLPQHYLSIIHPAAVVCASATIGSGTIIMPNAVINSKAEIGMHCIINTGGIIGHDNEVGNYTHVSPNATLTGRVTTGEGVHVGSSATIISNKHLGKWSVIGAGSTVIEHIPAYSKAVGCPTRINERILIK